MSKTIWSYVGTALLGAVLFWGCATPAVVFISPTYSQAHVQKVALLNFDDFSGTQGSGSTVADVFQKYLLSMNYQLVDRSQAAQVLQQMSITSVDQLTASQMSFLGKQLGVDAFILGSVSEYNDTSEQTVMEDMPQEETDPVYGQVTTRQRQGGQSVTTQQTVVTGYATSYTDQSVPETETLPAVVGLSVRMVAVTSGSLLWSGSGSANGMTLASASENASSKIIQALQKDLLAPSK